MELRKKKEINFSQTRNGENVPDKKIAYKDLYQNPRLIAMTRDSLRTAKELDSTVRAQVAKLRAVQQ